MIERTNVDDIFFRNATIAVMQYIEDNMALEQVENGEIVFHPVRVFYNKAQDNQFMKDYFTNYSTKCKNINFADGDFDLKPFAIVSLDGLNIKTNEMTNKFVRGNHVVIEYDDNNMEVKRAASSMLYCLPLSLKYNVEISTEDTVQSFRMLQSIFEGIFKNNVIHFGFRDLRIRANMSLDANFNHEKPIKLSYNDESTDQAIKFNIDVECNYPVFDKTTTLWRGNVIRNFRNYVEQEGEGTLSKSTVTYNSDKDMVVYNTTNLITEDKIKEYKDDGYSVIDTTDITDENKSTIAKQIGPFIINNREIVLVKYKDE